MSNYISEALLDSGYHKKLKEDAKVLVHKWDKTGLLENLDTDYNRSSMAILLENQARQLIQEASTTMPATGGVGANEEEWSGVALPLVRRIFAEIAAQEFVSVQPMNLPSGLVFYLDFKYGTARFGRSTTTGAEESVFGKVGPNSPSGSSTPYPESGLYGAGAYGYTTPSASGTLTFNAGGTADTTLATDSQLNFNSVVSHSYRAGGLFYVTSSALSGLTRADTLSARSWAFSTSSGDLGGKTVLPEFTKVITTSADGVQRLSLIVSSSEAAGEGTGSWATVYTQQPVEANRGDFEDRADTGNATTGNYADINIPEVNLDLKSLPIVAKTRKLKAVWTPELAQDLNAYHSVDAEAELTSMLSEYISMEIDLEIIDMLMADAVTVDYWSAKVGYDWTGTDFSTSVMSVNAMAYTKREWWATLGSKLQKVSNKIHQLTLRGGANFVVCSPDVATVIESIPGFNTDTDGTSAKFAMGVQQVGNLRNRWNVYKNPYMTENAILVGFRGSNFLETGAVYAPYVPLIMTPLVYDPQNFTPRKGVMTRYAKKMVRPEFYGKIYVDGLNAI